MGFAAGNAPLPGLETGEYAGERFLEAWEGTGMYRWKGLRDQLRRR